VFYPLNLEFNPHKRQLPSFPVTSGFTGVRGESMLEFVAFHDTALKKFTHGAAAVAALLRANRFAKVMLHVTKMSLVV